jgi:glycosyltransferase involved in cell wall biosynthesis
VQASPDWIPDPPQRVKGSNLMATLQTSPPVQPARRATQAVDLPVIWQNLRARVAEFLTFDAITFRMTLSVILYVAGRLLHACGQKQRGLKLLFSVHRSASSAWTSLAVERFLHKQLRPSASALEPPLHRTLRQYVDTLAPSPATAVFLKSPEKLIGTRFLVLKSAGPAEKGVLVIDYNFAFPIFLRMFDHQAIMQQYHVVLEPSWSGYCDPDILCFLPRAQPVFVQAIEPRDERFLRQLNSNLVPVPLAANWWVDHRMMKPLGSVTKDVDVIMIASWARFKRHQRFFAALAKLKRRGHHLKSVLIGYPVDSSLNEIRRLAASYGVDDQLEFYEKLLPEEVNYHFNRSRVNVIWSRKEGFNRTIVEGMFADVPFLLRTGFNYGHHHDYVNCHTGYFADEKELPDRLLWMVANLHQFSPREWALANMSCQQATAVLERSIRAIATNAGETWTRGLAVKVCHLNTMRYWDESERAAFVRDYDFLRTKLLGLPR